MLATELSNDRLGAEATGSRSSATRARTSPSAASSGPRTTARISTRRNMRALGRRRAWADLGARIGTCELLIERTSELEVDEIDGGHRQKKHSAEEGDPIGCVPPQRSCGRNCPEPVNPAGPLAD